MMRDLTPDERKRIEAAVAAAEKRTSVEFAVVVAKASDEYALFPLLWAGLLALMSGGVIAITLPVMSVATSFMIQAGIFISAGLLLQLKYLRPHLAPSAVQREYASRMARLQFSALVDEQTRNDNGLLLFVSIAERHVEILADNGITAHIPQAAFQNIIDGFIREVHQGNLTDGFTEAVESCTVLLQQHFPVRPDDRDEIPNQVTEI